MYVPDFDKNSVNKQPPVNKLMSFDIQRSSHIVRIKIYVKLYLGYRLLCLPSLQMQFLEKIDSDGIPLKKKSIFITSVIFLYNSRRI